MVKRHLIGICGGWKGAVRFGRGKCAVAEVDESDKSLVAFSPYAAAGESLS